MCFIAGILAASCCPPLGWLTLGVMVGGVAVLLARRSARPGVVILASVFFVGAAWYEVRMRVPSDDISRLPGIRTFDGTIAADPDVREGSVRLLITADSAETWTGRWRMSGFVLTNVDLRHDQPVTFEYGDRVRIAAHPYSPFDPPTPASFPGRLTFNDKGYMRAPAFATRPISRSCRATRQTQLLVSLMPPSTIFPPACPESTPIARPR